MPRPKVNKYYVWNACESKVAYGNEGAAQTAAARKGRPWRAYRCVHCRLWHLTTSEEWR